MEERCPCEAVKELQKIVNEHEKRLADGSTQFAVINTKLNVVLGVLSCVGVAVCGTVVALLFR